MVARVIVKGTVSDPFPITNGVKLGCVIAPTLFSLMFAAMLFKALSATEAGITARYRCDGRVFDLRRLKVLEAQVRDFLYADDCALAALSEPDLQELASCLSTVEVEQVQETHKQENLILRIIAYWHACKSLVKDLRKAYKEKDWMNSIKKHLYWCAMSTSQGFGELSVQLYESPSVPVEQHKAGDVRSTLSSSIQALSPGNASPNYGDPTERLKTIPSKQPTRVTSIAPTPTARSARPTRPSIFRYGEALEGLPPDVGTRRWVLPLTGNDIPKCNVDPLVPVRLRVQAEIHEPKLKSTDNAIAFWQGNADELPLLGKHVRKLFLAQVCRASVFQYCWGHCQCRTGNSRPSTHPMSGELRLCPFRGVFKEGIASRGCSYPKHALKHFLDIPKTSRAGLQVPDIPDVLHSEHIWDKRGVFIQDVHLGEELPVLGGEAYVACDFRGQKAAILFSRASAQSAEHSALQEGISTCREVDGHGNVGRRCQSGQQVLSEASEQIRQPDHKYYDQVHRQLYCCELDWVDFVVYFGQVLHTVHKVHGDTRPNLATAVANLPVSTAVLPPSAPLADGLYQFQPKWDLQGRAFGRHNVERAGRQVPPPVRERPPTAGGDSPTSPTATTELEQDLIDISDSIGDLSLEIGAMGPEEEPGTPAPGDDEPTPPMRGRRNAAQGRRGRRRYTPAFSTEEQRERILRLRERRTERLQDLFHAMTLEELQTIVLKVVDKQPAVLLDILDVDMQRGLLRMLQVALQVAALQEAEALQVEVEYVTEPQIHGAGKCCYCRTAIFVDLSKM
ncbi:hypothetical protein Bbelb_200400 [Branchiostoma belcheri]|nr:hypothetical protein Bbelb_200400 [Branchiostoma belcheri]